MNNNDIKAKIKIMDEFYVHYKIIDDWDRGIPVVDGLSQTGTFQPVTEITPTLKTNYKPNNKKRYIQSNRSHSEHIILSRIKN